MPSSMKICAVLLWGVCVLFPVESVTSSAQENSGTNFTVPPDITTNQRITAHASTLQPSTLPPAKPTAPAALATSPTADRKNGDRNTSKSESLTTAEVAISHSKPLTPTGKVTTNNVVSAKMTTGNTQTFPAGQATSTGKPLSVSQTITARREEETSAAVTTASDGVKSSTPIFTATSKGQSTSSRTTGHAHTVSEVTSTGRGLHPSTAMTTVTSEVQPLNRSTTAEAINQTTDHLRSSASSFTNTTAPAMHSATTSASFVSTQNSTSITGFRSEVPSTTSLDNSTQSTSNSSGPTTSVPTSGTTKSTSTELSSKSSSASATTNFNSTSTEPVSTSTDYSNTTANSTSPAGALIPHIIGSTTRSTPSTTKAPCVPSKDSSSNKVPPCSSRGVVKQCLIIIAVLALVATIFAISTIVLCIKLSSRKYKVRKPQQDTEMMCISSLLPDGSHTYTRQRNPVSNGGVLVYPRGGDSDEEGGDNLTLSSFLPENDRYI